MRSTEAATTAGDREIPTPQCTRTAPLDMLSTIVIKMDVEPGDAIRPRILNGKVEVADGGIPSPDRILAQGDHRHDLKGVGRGKRFGISAAA